MEFLSIQNDKILLKIYVMAGASKNEIVGSYGEPVRLKIKTNATPEDGKANKEIISYLSKILKIPKSQIEILRGHTSRQKDFLVSTSYDEVLAKLEEILR